jgi:hypothetical protein
MICGYKEKDEMNVNEYTVSDTEGNISEDNEGKILVSPEDPYRFYVRNPVYFITENPPTGTPAFLTVQIVMPLGDKESGLFRFPRVGEKVLVGTEEGTHYLLGYIPTYTNPQIQDFQTNGMSQDNGQGEVFRYRQTGKKEGREDNDLYSEIGFYNRQTQWNSSNPQYKNIPDLPRREANDRDEDYSTKLVSAGFPKKDGEESPEDHIARIKRETTKIPVIDQINIQSTGDIRQSAKNFQEIKAKRLEILSDIDSIDHTKSKSEHPSLDRMGDDSFLYNGDIHIRANNRVIIKAGSEIQLEVGRSRIVINDNGIVITSRKTRANVTNTLDTVLTLNARTGLAMFGEAVKIGAAWDFTIAENFGGAIKSHIGVMRISAKDLRASTFSTMKYGIIGAKECIDAVSNIATMVAGSSLASDESRTTSVPPSLLNTWGSYGGLGLGSGADFIGDMITYKKTEDENDCLGNYWSTLDIVFSLMNTVAVVLDILVPEKNQSNGSYRDILNTCLATAKYGILGAALGMLCTQSAEGFIHETALNMTSNAKIFIAAQEIKHSTIMQKDENSPVAALASKGSEEYIDNFKDGFKGFLKDLKETITEITKDEKKVAGVAVGAAAVLGGIIGLSAGTLPANSNWQESEEDRLENL